MYPLTMSACQVAVEQNLVGKVSLLGSYASGEILSYIQKGTLYGTVAADPKEMGKACLQELMAIQEHGLPREDVLMELITVDKNNVRDLRNQYASALRGGTP